MTLDPDRIMEMASAFYESSILFAASDLGVFEKLAESGPQTCNTLARELCLDPRGCRLLLDGCVATGLLAKEDDHYSNTPEAASFLVPGQPGDLSKAIRYNRDVYGAWGQLRDLVRTGKPVERPEVHLGEDKDRARSFVLAMHGRALGMGRALVSQIDVGKAKLLLDVGGGPGTFSVLLAQQNPALGCTVLDLPGIVAIADELILEQGMADRVKTIAGDYHVTEFPDGNDVVNFFGVLHQESPDSILDLMTRAWSALRPGGTVNIMDMMTDHTHAAPKFSALFAVNMALTTENGWVFSDGEMIAWLEEAGFENVTVRQLPPPMPHWLASASKPTS